MTIKIVNQEVFETLIQTLKEENFSGCVELKYQQSLSNHITNQTLIWNQGQIIFGDTKVPQNLTALTKLLGNIIYPTLIDTIIKFKIKSISSPNSILEMIHTLVELKIFFWSEIAEAIIPKVALIFEQLYGQRVSANIIPNNLSKLNYEYGIDWKRLNQKISERKIEFKKYNSIIPNYNYLPYLNINNDQLEELKQPVKEHLKKYITGQKSILEIANSLDKDPLIITSTYFKWFNLGWINFFSPDKKDNIIALKTVEKKSQLQVSKSLPIVLCVDDSPVIQAMVKKYLKDDYEVLTANNGLECLQILQKESINILLLDVSMPEIDGLEVCRTIRKIPKYKDLPIIMITAKDGLIDKFKGKVAGSTKYLTKPFDQAKLHKHIKPFIQS